LKAIHNKERRRGVENTGTDASAHFVVRTSVEAFVGYVIETIFCHFFKF